MHRLGYILLIILLLFGAYELVLHLPSSTQILNGKGGPLLPGQVLGADVSPPPPPSLWQKAKDLVSAPIERGKQIVEEVPKLIQNNIEFYVNHGKDAIREKAAGVLGITTSSPNSLSPTSSAIFLDKKNQMGICWSLSKGEQVYYNIGNPFADGNDVFYRIDWGDKTTSSGTIKGSQEYASVSHPYQQPGAYTDTFEFTNASGTFTASAKICVH